MFQPGVPGSNDSDSTGTPRICTIGPIYTRDEGRQFWREDGEWMVQLLGS